MVTSIILYLIPHQGTASGTTIRWINGSTVNLTASTVGTPTVTASGTLTSLTTVYGSASSTTNYTVAGSNLTTDITVTPPSGFEISKTSSSSGFATTQSLTQVSGTVATTTTLAMGRKRAEKIGSLGTRRYFEPQ